MEKKFYTYLHCKPNGEPFYVGKGSGNRAYTLTRRNKHHASIVKKYGKEKIGIYIFQCETEQQAFDDEIRDIAQLRSEGLILANVTNGGEGVSGLSKPVSLRQRKILSIKSKGNKNALGWKHNSETLKKMSDAMKARFDSMETAERLRRINQKQVVCVDTGEEFESATLAAKHFNMKDKSSVTKCCRGITSVAYGLVFKYKIN